MENRVCELFDIRYPVIQGGMVWVSGGKLAAAVSNAGGLGLVGAGSMDPDLFRHHIRRTFRETNRKFGVNIPIFSRYASEQVSVALAEGVPVFFMSAGSPRVFTERLKSENRIVVHVTSTPALAEKCQNIGVDAVVVEGVEAGGHNGRDELTTFVLIPQARDMLTIPLIAAGGIGDGRGIAAALVLGADGVQIGTRFAVTRESSASDAYKQKILDACGTDTVLMLKRMMPVRLVKNTLTGQLEKLEQRCAEPDELAEVLGKSAARRAIFEGDVGNGEVEAGQISGMIRDIPTTAELMERLVRETAVAIEALSCNPWYTRESDLDS